MCSSDFSNALCPNRMLRMSHAYFKHVYYKASTVVTVNWIDFFSEVRREYIFIKSLVYRNSGKIPYRDLTLFLPTPDFFSIPDDQSETSKQDNFSKITEIFLQ